jgi:hypothetical protein
MAGELPFGDIAGAAGLDFFPEDTTALQPGWTTVQTGLQLLAAGTIVGIGSTLLFILASFATAGAGDREIAGVFLVLIYGLSLVGFVLDAIGLFMCCATPQESGLYGLILAAAICWVTLLGSIATPFLFLVYLRGMGQHFHHDPLVRNSMSFLIAIAVSIPVLIMAVCAGVVAAGGSRREAAAYVGCVMLIGMVGSIIFSLVFLGLLNSARSLLTRARIRARAA